MGWEVKANWVGGQSHAPAALHQGNRSGTNFTGGWVDLRAVLKGCGISHPHRDSISGPSSPYRIAYTNYAILAQLEWM
jgi:hypothetical protein